MSALMSTFQMEAKGDAFIDADVRQELDAANAPQYNTAPRIDPMQAIRQVAEPGQPSANQPNVNSEQAAAVKQREQLTSKPATMGRALGQGDEGGAGRQASAEKAATKLATDVAKLDKVIAGGEAPKASAGGSFAKAAVGQVAGLAATGAAAAVGGPAAAALVGGALFAYDGAKAFSGQSQGPSAFSSRADATGYAASAPAQPQVMAQSAVTNSFQSMMNVPGDRKINGGDIENVGDGLRGITKAPPLSMTPAAVALAGVYKNGGEALASRGEDNKIDKDKLDFKPLDMKPALGVFAPPKPMGGLFG